jgi:hypothetical protein
LSRAQTLVKQGDKLFSRKAQVDSLFQEIALNFYPERADFTSKRNWGDEFANHLFASFPVVARRELGNILSAHLRPRGTRWFDVRVEDIELDENTPERRWLEFVSDIQWRAIYESRANFVNATKVTDHDFVAFGNGVLWFGRNTDLDGLLFRNYHLRDNAWSENVEERIDTNHRNWLPTVRQLASLFPDTVSKEVRDQLDKNPEKPVKVRHVVLPSEDFDSKFSARFPFVSVHVEKETDTILEEVGLNYFPYVIPRWHRVSGTPWGSSMTTGIILPDGRTMQAVVRTLREAGEKYVDPPMIAVNDAVRGDISLFAGGITTVDLDYDERLGDPLRPIAQNKTGMPIGFEIAQALRDDISAGFFLDKIQLPQTGAEMTAFEVRRRLEEHLRAQSPIFEPIEEQYNDPMMEGVFQVLRDNGAFPLDDMPETLDGRDISFSFRSPLADLAEQADAEIFLDVMQRIVMPVAEQDPAQLANVDMTTAVRDAMRSAGFKAEWLQPIEAVQQRAQVGNAAKAIDDGS